MLKSVDFVEFVLDLLLVRLDASNKVDLRSLQLFHERFNLHVELADYRLALGTLVGCLIQREGLIEQSIDLFGDLVLILILEPVNRVGYAALGVNYDEGIFARHGQLQVLVRILRVSEVFLEVSHHCIVSACGHRCFIVDEAEYADGLALLD